MKLHAAALVGVLAGGLLATPVAADASDAIDWPGGAATPAIESARLGGGVSGLALDGTGGLWAVRDSGALLHLERSGPAWKPTANDGERMLHYPGGGGTPDAEGVTTVAGDDSGIYVAAERNNDASSTSHNSILRYDRAGTGALSATREWNLKSIVGVTPANTGIESLTWIPDAVLVAMKLRDSNGKPYVPADYPNHGSGLFATAVEDRGEVMLIALGDDGETTLVANAATGLKSTMELSWSAARQELWAVCDDHCDGRAAVLVPGDGAFTIAAVVHPPAGFEKLNNEGFTIVADCEGGAMLAVWAEDASGSGGGATLREAPLPCGPVAAPVVPSSVSTTAAPSPGSSTVVASPTATTSAATASSAVTTNATTSATSTTSASASASSGASSGASSRNGRSGWYVGIGAAAVVVAGLVAYVLRRRATR